MLLYFYPIVVTKQKVTEWKMNTILASGVKKVTAAGGVLIGIIFSYFCNLTKSYWMKNKENGG